MMPSSFERFTIVRKLPAGGMGRVYEAVDTAGGRRVALKLIDRGTDPDTVQILAAERLGVELHKQLCALDPRITAVCEFGETAEYLYIVMEYVDGLDLSELAVKERLGFPFAARIAQDVLEVLSHAHNFHTSIDGREVRGVVHGDIKPRNIRLTHVGEVKVLDFGIAKALSLTRNFTQNMFGSVQYSSPERLSTGEVTIDSDLWSVGVVLFEMVARRPYFLADTAHKLEHMIRSYREVRPIPAGCPGPLQQILRRALSPVPELRYRTAAEFAADLDAFRHDRPLAVVSDLEATRRMARAANGDGVEVTTRSVAAVEAAEESNTGPLSEDIDATRRTGRSIDPPAGNHRPPTPATAPPAPAKSATPQAGSGVKWGRVTLLAALLAGAFVGYLFIHEYVVWKDARALAHDLDSEQIQKLDAAWDQYEDLARRANFGVTLWGVQDSLRNRLLTVADRAITEFRVSDAPMVTEGEWLRARVSVARALDLLPKDKTIRGKLRLVDGHISRIRGTARRDSRLLQDAREKFDEAAQLMPKSPDPWIGLSRLFVYSLHDVERGEQALKEAEKRGHEIGKRETGLLADGYRDRAERELREASNAMTQAEKDRYLDIAYRDFQHARTLYESIVPWGGSAQNLRKTFEGLDRQELMKAAPPLDPLPKEH
jgi:serine/threonine protein kinase